MINKTIAIFGVFDGIHDGHLFFIREAKKQGNRLVAIVARDEVVGPGGLRRGEVGQAVVVEVPQATP